jgi:ketohexokinase
LNVPYYPKEDHKPRATRFTRRRGSDTANSLGILSQLLKQNGTSEVELHLITLLPARSSLDNGLIQASLGYVTEESGELASNSSDMRVNLDYCLYRQNCSEAISSSIIASDATSSCAIFNHNALSETTFNEFFFSSNQRKSSTLQSSVQTVRTTTDCGSVSQVEYQM